MDTISDLPPTAPKLYKPPSYSNLSQPPHPIPPSQPHPNTNLLTLFNLTRLHSTIARKDAAGNKINKLRKSYEGKVKALGLQGSSRPVKGNAALQGLVDPAWDMEVGPEGETLWDAQRGGMPGGGDEEGGTGGENVGSAGHRSRNVLENENGLGGLITDFERVVADGLRPGRLPAPEHKRWEAVLGLNDSNAAANSGTGGRGAAGWARGRGAAGPGDDGSAGRNGNPHSVLSRASAAAGVGSAGGMRASAPASPAAAGAGGSARPERTGKKRRYDDASFDGYAQTFASSSAAGGGGGAGLNTDDEGVSSSGGGGGGGGAKRPRVGSGGEGGSGSQQSQQQQQRRVGAMASS
ncbi:hypothetical protein KC345_g479 [Hortaea werneckii]|nr:hypothetical protein KC345_g479 [Hortaea werneckii]